MEAAKSLLFAAILVIFSLFGLAADAGAQAIAHPNQIKGVVEFTNTSPAMLALLDGPSDKPPGLGLGLDDVCVTAKSLPPQSPTLWHQTHLDPLGRLNTPYEITVEYEPAPDVPLDFRECARAVKLMFQDEDGTPTAITEGWFDAYIEDSPGSGKYTNRQAYGHLSHSATEQYIVLRGESDHDGIPDHTDFYSWGSAVTAMGSSAVAPGALSPTPKPLYFYRVRGRNCSANPGP